MRPPVEDAGESARLPALALPAPDVPLTRRAGRSGIEETEEDRADWGDPLLFLAGARLKCGAIKEAGMCESERWERGRGEQDPG